VTADPEEQAKQDRAGTAVLVASVDRLATDLEVPGEKAVREGTESPQEWVETEDPEEREPRGFL